jgi:SAM-dependent methyltransferase
VFAALGAPLPAAAEWPRWIAEADAATRARVAEGDELSIVNLLMFGTSFTREPRLTSRQLDGTDIQAALSRRLDDFERALAKPDANARLEFARRLLPSAGPVRPRLLAMIDRAIKDAAVHAKLTEEAQALVDPSLEFAERSRLYRGRGLASDTSVRVNFAIEEALRGLTPVMVRGSDPKRAVRRVAVIGPGLDVVDKEEGHDFYPPQTIQPFALIDSLVRLGLADGATLRMTTLDVSARVNDHIAEMVRRAGAQYVLHISLDGAVAWRPELLKYFATFGDAIGAPVPVTVPPGIGPVRLRALSVRPSVVQRIAARDLNITAQVLALSDDERFDLIVGTNVFLYYDRLQQALAMASVARMLRPGGLLLSNNALVEAPSTGMHSIGYSKTLYSNRDEDGDLIISYQKQ